MVTKLFRHQYALLFLLSISGSLSAQDTAVVIPLWKNGAPDFEQLKTIPEQAKDWWVNTINNPSVTIKEKIVGVAWNKFR
jgi:hypothetical protein